MVGQILFMVGSFFVSAEIDSLQERRTELSELETEYENLGYKFVHGLTDPTKKNLAADTFRARWSELESSRLKAIKRANNISPWPSNLEPIDLDASMRGVNFSFDSLGWRARLRKPIVAFEGSPLVAGAFPLYRVLTPFVAAGASYAGASLLAQYLGIFTPQDVGGIAFVGGLFGGLTQLGVTFAFYPFILKKVFRIDSDAQASGGLSGGRKITTVRFDQYDELNNEVLRPLNSASDRFWEVLSRYGIPGPKYIWGTDSSTPVLEVALAASYARGEITDELLDHEPFRSSAIRKIAEWIQGYGSTAPQTLVQFAKQGLVQIREGKMTVSQFRSKIEKHPNAKGAFVDLRTFQSSFQAPRILPTDALSAYVLDMILSDEKSFEMLESISRDIKPLDKPTPFRVNIFNYVEAADGFDGLATIEIILGGQQIVKKIVRHQISRADPNYADHLSILSSSEGEITTFLEGSFSCRAVLESLATATAK